MASGPTVHLLAGLGVVCGEQTPSLTAEAVVDSHWPTLPFSSSPYIDSLSEENIFLSGHWQRLDRSLVGKYLQIEFKSWVSVTTACSLIDIDLSPLSHSSLRSATVEKLSKWMRSNNSAQQEAAICPFLTRSLPSV